MENKSSKTIWTFLSVIFLFCSASFYSCNGNNFKELDSGQIKFLKADSAQFERGGTVEWVIVDKCLRNQVTLENLQHFIEGGGNVNAFIYHSHEETLEYQTTNIPILEAFEPEGEYTIKPTYRINVFQALMMQAPENKMEMCTYLLKNGADPNLRSPDGLVAAEYLLIQQERDDNWLMLEGDEFWEGLDLIQAYSFRFIDTLIAYGSKTENVNLKYAGSSYELLLRYLRSGADPKTVDVTAVLMDTWVGSIFFEELMTYKIDFSQLRADEFMDDSHASYKLEILFDKFGFAPDTEVSDGYLLYWSIIEDNFEAVKLIVEKGGTKMNEDKNPYLFAKEQGASESILEFLADKFGTKP